jgi:hypothetical protein
MRRKIDNGIPRIVLCLGLKSSGSTWLFNAVAGILRHATRGRRNRNVVALYADDFSMLPERAALASTLVVKSHEPSDALMFLARFARAKILVSVREPRDAVASLMLRFHHAFEPTLKDMERQSASVARWTSRQNAAVFRYENLFFEDRGTIDRLAAVLGAKISAAAGNRLFRSLERERVRKKIATLAEKGKFGSRPGPDSFDPVTHWHPGHVGDGKVGKFEAVLTPAQQRRVVAATRAYCRTFRYVPAPAKSVSRRKSAR